MTSATDDPIAETVLSDDPEARARYAEWALLGRYDLTTKLYAVAAISGLAAVALWATTTFWGRDLQETLGGDPLAASIAASIVLAAGLKFLTLGAGGLVLSGVLRRRAIDRIDPERILAVEETASLLGLGTGGLGTTIGVGLLVLIATTDPLSAGAWLARLIAPVALPVTYRIILWWAVGLIAACLAASVVFGADRRSEGETVG